MPGENLTREEASHRAQQLSVESYLVELDVTRDDKTFQSKTTIRFGCSEVGYESFIDAQLRAWKRLF